MIADLQWSKAGPAIWRAESAEGAVYIVGRWPSDPDAGWYAVSVADGRIHMRIATLRDAKALCALWHRRWLDADPTLSRLDARCRSEILEALGVRSFAGVVEALQRARFTLRSILCALGLAYSTCALRLWRDTDRAPDEAMVAAYRLATDEGWQRAVEARALYPDRRGRARRER